MVEANFFYYLVESAIFNSYIVEAHVRPAEHAQKGSAKRDYLEFHLELAVELIGTFSSRTSSK